jgi:hypothetical protein
VATLQTGPEAAQVVQTQVVVAVVEITDNQAAQAL